MMKLEQVSAVTEPQLGIPSLDQQRTKLKELLELLQAAQEHQAAMQLVCPMLRDLHDYLTQHCLYEEQLMDEVAYPYREEHRRIHHELLNAIQQEMETISTHRLSHCGGLLQQIGDRIRGHMDQADGEFIQRLKAHPEFSG